MIGTVVFEPENECTGMNMTHDCVKEIVMRSFKSFCMILRVWVRGFEVSKVKEMRIIPYGHDVSLLVFSHNS